MPFQPRIHLLLGVACATAWLPLLTAEDNSEKLVPLKTSIPEAVFDSVKGGGPKLRNLEPIETKQKPLLVPRGLSNLALGKPVTSSDANPLRGALSDVTDGKKEIAEKSCVTLAGGKQWVQIDLESEAEIFGIWLWHQYHGTRAYLDVVIMVSNDADFADATEVTIYNNDHDGSSGFGMGKDKAYAETNRGRTIDGKGTKGRYVRFYSDGSTRNEMNDYIEVEIWGRVITPRS